MKISIYLPFVRTFESKKSEANTKFVFIFFEKLSFPDTNAILSAKSKQRKGDILWDQFWKRLCLYVSAFLGR